MGAPGGDETLPSHASTSDAATERFAIGSLAAERYRIERFIAAGGMGEVYAAHDLVLDTKVALKTLRPELEGSADAIARLRREIALARSVTDPHICRLHDVGEHDGRVFLSMELLEGRTLAELVKAGGMALDEIERIAPQLVAGLGVLHRASIVHRDFKTSNVIVVGDRAVITDFGLARSVDAKDSRLTVESGLLGTPAYMAPEQVEARAVTPASDIYSLGVVLFELLTGKLPFDEDTAMATATARLTKDPPRPSSLRSDIPARWDAIVLRCLARDPAARFASVDELLGHKPVSRRWFLAVGGGGIAAAALGVWKFAASSGANTPAVTRSPDDLIAVLPVLGAGPWIKDSWRTAITFDLHSALVQLGMPVLALHTGAMDATLNGAASRLLDEKDPVAAALAVPHVVTAVTMTIARTATHVELAVTARGRESWSQTLRRPLTEVALVVHDAATAIAGRLGYAPPIAPVDARHIAADGYTHYGDTVGRMYRQPTPEEIEAFTQKRMATPFTQLADLVEAQPRLARAQDIAADRLVMAAEQRNDYTKVEKTLTIVDKLTDEAIAADPRDALMHAVRGHAAMIRWDWKRADEETKRGFELAPLHERVAYHRSNFLHLVGRFDEALPIFETQHRINPNPRLGDGPLAWAYFYARRYPDAIRVLEPVMNRFDLTNFVEATYATTLPLAYVELARFDDAFRVAETLRPYVDDDNLAVLLPVYLAAGKTDVVKAIREKLGDNIDFMVGAALAEANGDLEGSLTLLEQMVASHNIGALFLKVERYSPQMRSHPRFQALLKQVGFPS
ncbi:MAG TPA: serine/threonine-protein kinase [Kofleriaceae bacterium]|nr:serine/threonine-protein kinase [Kofleriaceae bacterium]